MDLKIKVKKKDLLQYISGGALIVLTLLANGLLSCIPIGFDFSQIMTSAYWAHYVTLSASELCVLMGMFIIQKTKDLNTDKIIKLKEHINDRREIVYGVDKITEAEDWLRDVYNYKQKLLIFEQKIKNIYEKITLVELTPDATKKQINKYNKKKAKKDFCLLQFEFIKKDKQRIALLVNHQDTTELDKALSTSDYAFKKTKIKYKEVYWGNLLSDFETSKEASNTPFFSEKKELASNIAKYFAYALISSSLLSALVTPAIKTLTWGTILYILFTITILVFFMIKGISLSHSIILGTYYSALEKRKSIYNQMLKDLGISQIVVEEEND